VRRWRAALLVHAGVAVLFASGVASRVPDVRRTVIGRAPPGSSDAEPPVASALHITQLSDLHLRDDAALNAQNAAVARSAGGERIVLTGDVVDPLTTRRATGRPRPPPAPRSGR
jgi:hypothetical protein